MSELTVAFLDPLHPRIEDAVHRHVPRGWTPRFAASRDADSQERVVADADVAFLIGMPVPCALIARATRLTFIQKLGVGTDKIDLAACRARGIAVARISGGNAIPVAEHALLLMLATLRRLPLIDRRTREGEWQKEESRGIHRQISGRRVGIVGFGAIGRTVARLLSGFNAEVVCYDPMPCSAEVLRDLSVAPMDLDELLRTSDIVTLHLPLTDETRGFLSAERIAAMKSGAVVVNCARGGLIDEAALLRALESGHLMGAGLDVFEQEPPANNPLLLNNSTVVTPHLAGATLDNFINVLTRGISNTRQYRETGRLPDADAVILPRQR